LPQIRELRLHRAASMAQHRPAGQPRKLSCGNSVTTGSIPKKANSRANRAAIVVVRALSLAAQKILQALLNPLGSASFQGEGVVP
jgi:hypothetical protein